MPVIVTEDGDILSISYGPHDRGYDNPHFVAIPGDGTGSGSSSPSLLERIAFTFYKPPRGVIKPLPQRLGAPLAASPTRTTPPQSGGKREAPQRASGDAKHRRGRQCPPGHYWSYKQNKCVKSKF